MANPNLNIRQRDDAITSKLMEGPYQGIRDFFFQIILTKLFLIT